MHDMHDIISSCWTRGVCVCVHAYVCECVRVYGNSIPYWLPQRADDLIRFIFFATFCVSLHLKINCDCQLKFIMFTVMNSTVYLKKVQTKAISINGYLHMNAESGDKHKILVSEECQFTFVVQLLLTNHVWVCFGVIQRSLLESHVISDSSDGPICYLNIHCSHRLTHHQTLAHGWEIETICKPVSELLQKVYLGLNGSNMMVGIYLS